MSCMLMVRSFLLSDDTVYRWIGLPQHTTVVECRRIVATVFDIDGEVGSDTDGALTIGELLRFPGDTLHFHWGLWEFQMQLAEIHLGESDDAAAMCVAGAGEFGPHPFDIRAVNAELLAGRLPRREFIPE